MGLGHPPCGGSCEREPGPQAGPLFLESGSLGLQFGVALPEGVAVTGQGICGRGLCGKGKKYTFSYLVAVDGGFFSNPCRLGSTGTAYSFLESLSLGLLPYLPGSPSTLCCPGNFSHCALLYGYIKLLSLRPEVGPNFSLHLPCCHLCPPQKELDVINLVDTVNELPNGWQWIAETRLHPFKRF